MNLTPHIKDNLLKIKVIPSSSRTELILDGGKARVYLRAVPDKNKANQELIKFFKKELKLSVEIKSGMKTREKTLRILNNS